MTPFVEELFVRSWLLRYVDVAETRKLVPVGADRALLLAQLRRSSRSGSCSATRRSEWGVMFGWTLLTMAWFYHRKHLAPLVLVHAVTNGAIFAFVRCFDGVFRDASGAPISLWFFL